MSGILPLALAIMQVWSVITWVIFVSIFALLSYGQTFPSPYFFIKFTLETVLQRKSMISQFSLTSPINGPTV